MPRVFIKKSFTQKVGSGPETDAKKLKIIEYRFCQRLAEVSFKEEPGTRLFQKRPPLPTYPPQIRSYSGLFTSFGLVFLLSTSGTLFTNSSPKFPVSRTKPHAFFIFFEDAGPPENHDVVHKGTTRAKKIK